MPIDDTVLEQVRTDGFAIVEGFLDPSELAAARAGLFEEFPDPATFLADPGGHHDLVSHPLAGLRLGPFRSWDLTRMAFHPDLVDAAERFCGSSDLHLYKIELWAKYSGGDYEQPFHRDFGNHSLVVPRVDQRWPQLTSFILLSDVTEDDGPTKVIPRPVGLDIPLLPRTLPRGELHDREVSITGPAGSLFLYTTDILHRGSAIGPANRSRFALLADYVGQGHPWMGKMSWPGRALNPGFEQLITRASPRERELFGFPPVGHEYWNEQTLRDVAARYPSMDMAPYHPGRSFG